MATVAKAIAFAETFHRYSHITIRSPRRLYHSCRDIYTPEISPWHDIPLHLGDGVLFNFVVEIPKDTLCQNGGCYCYSINWNNGLLPQTWEDLLFSNPEVEGALGDNDSGILASLCFVHLTFPLLNTKQILFVFNCFPNFYFNIVEIGERRRKISQILKVKPLAALAMIDEGEFDWKIVAISLDDPRASLLNDVEKHFPICPVISSCT
ncbi:hypothetical protein CRYUN_Cryun35bG0045100 [Craigia yunnanensis]